MSIPPKKEFLEGDEVDVALHALHEAIAASVVEHGGAGVKSFAVLVRTDIGTGVVTDGCGCTSCQIEMMQAFAEAYGATTKLSIDGKIAEDTKPVLHS
jgi:hypothetical protein